MSASFLYYPGCSMGGSAKAYADSLEEVCGPLGLDLHEIPDWNCCGASEYMSLGPLQAYALISRNLALAARARNGTDTLVAPCSLCFANLARTDHALRRDPRLRERVGTSLAAGGLHYEPGAVQVRHLFDVIVRDVGIEEVARHVTRPLIGLKVAPYLGCLVSRPDLDDRWPLREHPLELDRLLAALGAEVVDYPMRTDCCGGHLSQISPETGLGMIDRLVDTAERRGADLMVTVCPMCQMNVDLYQPEAARRFGSHHHMPVLFFTQLIALAFGADAKAAGIGSEVVSAAEALAKIRVEVPPPGSDAERPAPRARREKRPAGLPMPVMADAPEPRKQGRR
jgi:heterodisulfide reductase subunit B